MSQDPVPVVLQGPLELDPFDSFAAPVFSQCLNRLSLDRLHPEVLSLLPSSSLGLPSALILEELPKQPDLLEYDVLLARCFLLVSQAPVTFFIILLFRMLVLDSIP